MGDGGRAFGRYHCRFITLFAIATRNGVMLVSHIQHVQKFDGMTDLREAVVRASEDRLIPILMTALAAGLALVPLALAMGEPGSEIQTPMAIVILFGLASSTALYLKLTQKEETP